MKPNVKLVSIDDNRKRAWKYSRPNTDRSKDHLNEFGTMDIGVNSLCNLTFEITSSVVFRDWLLSIRPIFCWARSSRVIAMRDATISAEFGGVGQGALDAVIAKSTDNNQDAIREGLPLSMSTSYTVSMDMRTCVGMLKTMWEVDITMSNTYAPKFWEECKGIPGFMNSRVKSFTDTYMPNDQDKEFRGVERLGGMIAGRYSMKGALFSQFIRSSHAKIKSGLWEELSTKGYIETGSLTQADKFDITFYMDEAVYHNMMKLRSHWFADWSDDMWGGLVGDYVKDMSTQQFWEFTPAGEGRQDPYKQELLNRVEGTDPNLPCPIMIESHQIIQDREDLFGGSELLYRYSNLAINGYIKDNPNNKLRIKYESLKKHK